MFNHISFRIVDLLIGEKIIQTEDAEVYCYGVQTIFSYLVSFVTIIAIGLVTGQLLGLLLFQFVFIALRSYAGGYHASSKLKCWILSVTLNVLVIYLLRYLPLWFAPGCSFFLLLAGTAIVICTVPVINRNKPLDSVEVLMYRHRARLLVCMEAIIAVLLFLLSRYYMMWSVVLGIFFVSMSLIAGQKSNVKL